MGTDVVIKIIFNFDVRKAMPLRFTGLWNVWLTVVIEDSLSGLVMLVGVADKLCSWS